jgi:hypothetical protein
MPILAPSDSPSAAGGDVSAVAGPVADVCATELLLELLLLVVLSSRLDTSELELVVAVSEELVLLLLLLLLVLVVKVELELVLDENSELAEEIPVLTSLGDSAAQLKVFWQSPCPWLSPALAAMHWLRLSLQMKKGIVDS